jgi:hypothetical protein
MFGYERQCEELNRRAAAERAKEEEEDYAKSLQRYKAGFAAEPVDTTKKDTNPKDAVGVRKAPLSCLPTNVLFEIGVGMLEGARKYGRHNWRAIGVRSSVYYDAAMRHLAQWWEGEDIDADSGIHHVSKAIACLMVLRDAQIRKMCQDDRPPSTVEWLGELNEKAGAVIDKYPDAKTPYTEHSRHSKEVFV